jgi:hypothetical protein
MAVSPLVSFRCSACNARLRAPARLVGQARPCPACREQVVMQPTPPPPAGPVLVFEGIRLPPRAYETFGA